MNKWVIIAVVLLAALGITGFVVYKTIQKSFSVTPSTNNSQSSNSNTDDQNVPENKDVEVDVKKSANVDNTVVLAVSKLGGKYSGIAYELTYESNGIQKGVNSGSKPIDVTGKDTFDRDVYMGTCSKQVCKPDPGVTKVSVNLEFTDAQGNKTQFSKDYPL